MEGRAEPITVRAGGEVDMHHGDTIHLTPDLERLHKFDAEGLRID
jgi:multiple sugar transport system ATP-binding protein